MSKSTLKRWPPTKILKLACVHFNHITETQVNTIIYQVKRVLLENPLQGLTRLKTINITSWKKKESKAMNCQQAEIILKVNK